MKMLSISSVMTRLGSVLWFTTAVLTSIYFPNYFVEVLQYRTTPFAIGTELRALGVIGVIVYCVVFGVNLIVRSEHIARWATKGLQA
jgi:hypothetical protein